MKRNHWVAMLATSLGLVVLTATASAINYGGIGAKPANPQAGNPRSQSIFIYQLKPGQQASDGLKVMNNTPQSQTIALYAVDSVVSSDGSFACAQNADPKHDVGDWIKLSQDQVTLGPNSNTVVPFTVNVPADKSVSVGEHDGCIAIQAASQTATTSSHAGVLLSFRTATRVVVTVPGKIIKRLSVDSVHVDPSAKNKLLITPHITNAGNVSLDARLSTRVLSVFGVQAEAVQNGTNPVLPKDTASWNFTVKKPFWGGFYRAEALATYNANPATGLGVGQHNDQRTVSKASAWFFVTPAVPALIIELLVLLLIIGAIYWYVQRHRHRAHVRNHWADYTVKARDTLPALAEQRGVDWQRIARANKLKAPYQLEKGQVLRLPPKQE